MAPIQVLHGQPTPEELATVLAVVHSRAAAAQAAAEAAAAPPPERAPVVWSEPDFEEYAEEEPAAEPGEGAQE
jgi:Acyl-CoA carboxylase epsilon subunit